MEFAGQCMFFLNYHVASIIIGKKNILPYPFKGKYVFVQSISLTGSEKSTHVSDVKYFVQYSILYFRFLKDNPF